MTFLQPFILYGLPLIGLPILIHLINRRRHRTVPWAAMMFLLDANRLQKNMAKLRYWIIMAMRMLAIAALLFTASRPYSSGWLGSAVGGHAETAILLLDRSPSMEQQDPNTRVSKRARAIAQLTDFLATTGQSKRTVLIESTRYEAEEVDVKQLAELTQTQGTATTADLPRLFQTALDYVVDNEIGQADVWVASDLRESDWLSDDGRWAALRQAFAEREGIRFHILAYPQVSQNNLSVTVTNVRKRTQENQVELVLDVRVARDQRGAAVPLSLEFVVNGARSALSVLVEEDEFVLREHVIPIDSALAAGWGRVEIPGDENPADNVHYFVFADEPIRHTTLVAEQPNEVAPLRIAASRGAEPALRYDATVLAPAQEAEIDWANTSLVVWQAALPTGLAAEQMQAFLKSGRPVLFFPPAAPTATEFTGFRWSRWQESQEPMGIASMLTDSDLLARTQNGQALPLNKLQTRRYCQLEGKGKSLARFTNGEPLLVRSLEDLPAYFCTTLPLGEHSSLARDGVALYVMTQRAIDQGALQLGDAKNREAGSAQLAQVSDWQLLSTLPEAVVSSSRAHHAAAYATADEQFVSINRSDSEDDLRPVQDESLSAMLAGLDYHKIDDTLAEDSPLASEIWRLFLVLMALALIVEASLCLQ